MKFFWRLEKESYKIKRSLQLFNGEQQIEEHCLEHKEKNRRNEEAEKEKDKGLLKNVIFIYLLYKHNFLQMETILNILWNIQFVKNTNIYNLNLNKNKRKGEEPFRFRKEKWYILNQ